MNNRGFGLVTVLVASALGAMMLLFLSKGIHSVRLAERGVASNLDQSQIVQLARMMLSDSQLCKKTGLVNTNLKPLLNPSPQPVAIILGFSNDKPLLEAGAVPTSTRFVESLVVSHLQEYATTATHKAYLATIQITTPVIGKGTSLRKGTTALYTKLITDISGSITDCGENLPALEVDEPTPSRPIASEDPTGALIYKGICATETVVSDKSTGYLERKSYCKCNRKESVMVLVDDYRYDDRHEVGGGNTMGSGITSCRVENMGTKGVRGVARADAHEGAVVKTYCRFACFEEK